MKMHMCENVSYCVFGFNLINKSPPPPPPTKKPMNLFFSVSYDVMYSLQITYINLCSIFTIVVMVVRVQWIISIKLTTYMFIFIRLC